MKLIPRLIDWFLFPAILAVVSGCAGPAPWSVAQTGVGPVQPDWRSRYIAPTAHTPRSTTPLSHEVRGQNAGYPANDFDPFATSPEGYRRLPTASGGPTSGILQGAVTGPITTYQPPPTTPLYPPGSQPPFGPPPAPAPAGPGGFVPGPAPFTSPPSLPPPIIPPPVGGELGLPPNFADIDAFVEEARTGRFMFGVGVNSNAGVTGQIVLDERNFDITRVPTSWQDFVNGTAFRGAGQGFRLEALPGTQVQRYLASFTEPYLFDTPISLNVSGFYFTRNYFDWDEQRLGGRLALGYRLTHDISLSVGLRAEGVDIRNPRVPPTVEPQLDEVLGDNDVYSGEVTLTYDTRDMPFAPTEGHLIELSFQQTFGSFDYPHGEIDFRKYHLVLERPDGSGRHTFSYGVRAGFSGSQTPIYDHFFAGGFSTLRGFDFRRASPIGGGGVIVGGEFQFLGTVEYLFPLTADDMLKAVVFCDFGTVEDDVRFDGDTVRVAPGFGLRINVPAMGPAPLAFDFAFPVKSAPFDREEIFSFFIGFGRL